jgi:hypothetical protein
VLAYLAEIVTTSTDEDIVLASLLTMLNLSTDNRTQVVLRWLHPSRFVNGATMT